MQRKTLKNVTLQIFSFVQVSEMIKTSTIWCNVRFALFTCIVNCSENGHKVNNTTYGEFFLLVNLLTVCVKVDAGEAWGR